ncbi:MAG: hypothetical protein AB1717_10780 [Pseudomonadota bacterium]
MNQTNTAAHAGGRASHAHEKAPGGNGGDWRKAHQHDSSTSTAAQRARLLDALRVVAAQADEAQSIAREIIQQGNDVAPFSLIQRAARVVAICGTLGERLRSEAAHAKH